MPTYYKDGYCWYKPGACQLVSPSSNVHDYDLAY